MKRRFFNIFPSLPPISNSSFIFTSFPRTLSFLLTNPSRVRIQDGALLLKYIRVAGLGGHKFQFERKTMQQLLSRSSASLYRGNWLLARGLVLSSKAWLLGDRKRVW